MNKNFLYRCLHPFASISSFYYSRKGSFVALFHGVHKKKYGLPKEAQNELTIQEFDKVLKWLSRRFNFLTPQQFFEGAKGGVLLTFDDGLANNYHNAIPILEKYNAPAIYFISTQHIIEPRNWLWFVKNRASVVWNNIPQDVPEQIRKDLYDGMTERELLETSKHSLIEIGAHTISHPDLIDFPLAKVEAELKESKSYLEELINKDVKYFAYPRGLYNNEIVKITSHLFEAAFAVDEYNTKSKYEIPRVSLHDSSNTYLILKFSGLHKPPFQYSNKQ